MNDGTVGMPCQSNVNCQPAGGPGLNTCSTSAFAGGALYATGVCVHRGCGPVTDNTAVHFCDGPDTPSSPGVCLALGSTPFCLPKCTFLADGSPPAGCLNKTACNVAEFLPNADRTAVTSAIGYCFGGCKADPDCPTGNRCQSDLGVCVTTLTTPTKAPGTPCTSADNTTGACACLILTGASDGGTATNGICAPFCVSGASSGCPVAFVCDALLQKSYSGIAGFTTQNQGLGGYCLPRCGTTSGDAAACPANSTCSALSTAGPDCLP